MAEVIVRTKIYVENPEEIGKIEEEIKKSFKVGESKIEELGFGIKILKVVFMIDEKEGIDKSEEKLKGINGVKQVEIESVDRAL